MERRAFVRGALGMAAGAAFRVPAKSASEAGQGERLGKIALEEHFMAPDFMGYFAERRTRTSARRSRGRLRRR